MKLIPTILATAVAISGTASAASIGLSFGNDAAGGGGDTTFLSTDTAGVTGASNWNGNIGNNGTIADLNDNSGAASGVSATWASDESWASFGAAETTDAKLVSGWLSNNTTGKVGTLDITNIAYANYDLYLYVTHDRALNNMLFSETNSAFADTSILENIDGTTSAADPFVYVEGSGGTGNYVKISGLSAATLNIEFSNPAGNRAGFAGFEIVAVPEPSSTALLGLGGLALILRRRK